MVILRERLTNELFSESEIMKQHYIIGLDTDYITGIDFETKVPFIAFFNNSNKEIVNQIKYLQKQSELRLKDLPEKCAVFSFLSSKNTKSVINIIEKLHRYLISLEFYVSETNNLTKK